MHGWDLEVIDLRSLVPLDFETVATSIMKTGRCVVLHEVPRTLGMGTGSGARARRRSSSGTSRPRCCGPPGSTPPTRRLGSSGCGCRGSTASLDTVQRSLAYDRA